MFESREIFTKDGGVITGVAVIRSAAYLALDAVMISMASQNGFEEFLSRHDVPGRTGTHETTPYPASALGLPTSRTNQELGGPQPLNHEDRTMHHPVRDRLPPSAPTADVISAEEKRKQRIRVKSLRQRIRAKERMDTLERTNRVLHNRVSLLEKSNERIRKALEL